METTLNYVQAPGLTAPAQQTAGQVKETTDIWQVAETNRIGINMLVLGFSMIFGGIATPYASAMGDWPLALVLFPSVFSLIFVIAVAPIKWIAYTGAFAMAMSSIMIIAGALMGVS